MNFLFDLSISKYSIFFVFWNVFLAMVPCVIVYFLAKAVGRNSWKQIKWGWRIGFVILFLFWLFFLPNTAYLFTMVRHLVDYCSDFDKYRVCVEGAWMPIFFFAYALIGLPTFYYALKKMSQIFGALFGKLVSTVLPIIVIPLTSIGVMFGLFERYNSWDILVKPLTVFKSSIGYFTDKILFLNFVIFTIIFYLIYYGTVYFKKR